MANLIFITHANVIIDKDIPVPEWSLSNIGRKKHYKFNNNSIVSNINTIFSSSEKKAIDGAEILASHLKKRYFIINNLHENDRSSTGFLPPDEFQKTADLFFKNPKISIRGCEKAIDAQNRIYNTVKSIINKNKNKNIAIVSHGGVGTLLLCKLMHKKINRLYDQPNNGGGNYFIVDTNNLSLISGWKNIDE